MPALRETTADTLLKELQWRWTNHRVMVRWLAKFFNYLDRCCTLVPGPGCYSQLPDPRLQLTVESMLHDARVLLVAHCSLRGSLCRMQLCSCLLPAQSAV